MTTVIISLETNNTVKEIFDSIPLGRQLEDADILAKYYKDDNNVICHEGKQVKIKIFPRTLTIYCKKDEKEFKIRWFYSKAINKIHIASGLKQDTASSYLNNLIEILKDKIKMKNVGTVRNILVNGLAQAKRGLNLYKLSEDLVEKKINFVYTPDIHAALKIYTDYGTVSLHSSGKILYMGSKDMEILMKLHDKISKLGKSWEGVPILIGV